MSYRYFVADTETTGADKTSGVVEVGFIEIDENFNIIDQQESLIDPQQPISPSASGVHGLVYDDVKDSPTLEEYFSLNAPGCYGKPLTGDVVIIGHRISFDMMFLAPHVKTLKQELCTLRWSRYLFPDSPDHKLQTLKYLLGLPREGKAHRVMADIMDAYHLTRKLCEVTGKTLRQLTDDSANPMMISICPFGKHKGQPMTQVPRSYLSWMRSNMELDVDMQFTVDSLLYGNKKN